MSNPKKRCLILACGNTLRGDDGAGPWLAEWTEQRFQNQAGVRVISRQQWTLELAEEVAQSQFVLFLDCSIDSAPGSVLLMPVNPAADTQGIDTHRQGPAELLALSRELYSSLPQQAQLLTVGAGSTELGESFSEVVQAALPEACRVIEATVQQWLGK